MRIGHADAEFAICMRPVCIGVRGINPFFSKQYTLLRNVCKCTKQTPKISKRQCQVCDIRHNSEHRVVVQPSRHASPSCFTRPQTRKHWVTFMFFYFPL